MDTVKTHFPMGVALGQTFYQTIPGLGMVGVPEAIVFCIASILPDVPAALITIRDTFVRRIPAFSELSNADKTMLEVVNSFIVWGLIWIVTLWVTPTAAGSAVRELWLVHIPFVWEKVFYALLLGVSLHLILDVFTHGRGDNPELNDVTYLWPLPKRFSLGPYLGFYEYRQQQGFQRAKLGEKVAGTALVVWATLECLVIGWTVWDLIP